ncbi:MAG TPA: methyltransferase domain-containing protein, partial [Planctomycetaceae bacterium]|nr:methyltransferase domain-containing protein [Planctomycetaceae bacterium]
MTRACRICRHEELSFELNLGAAAFCVEAPCSAEAARAIPKHPFRLGSCPACGVIQLIDLPPLKALQPAEHAILYRDPERHLDDLARATAALLPSPNAQIVGMSYKDAPFLEWLSSLGFKAGRVLDRQADWGFTQAREGIETLQAHCTPAWAEGIRAKLGPIDLLVVRHVLEHAHDPPAFLAACRRLVEPQGRVLFEVPGCDTEFARGDCGALWEEHVSYFTADSLRATLALHGFHPRLVG